VGFTLTVYSHALPGYDREAADVMTALILGEVEEDGAEEDRMRLVSKSVSKRRGNAPGDHLSRGVFPGSGGRI
jgi:hypothetical protein